jgi:16S rRNA (uracil1498-N3)-methyltransferase
MTTFYDEHCSPAITVLPEDESKHALKSLRLKVNEVFQIVNGKGLVVKALMTGQENGLVTFDVISFDQMAKRGPRLHIAVSPLKQPDRFEFFIEKATELGVDEITPILCQRNEKNRIKEERLNRIIISAMKQSGNPFLPRLNPAINFTSFLQTAQSDIKLIGHCAVGEKSSIGNMRFKSDTTVAIGPEGDFSEAELKMAFEHEFQAVSFGDLTLRTETAAITACACFQINKEL